MSLLITHSKYYFLRDYVAVNTEYDVTGEDKKLVEYLLKTASEGMGEKTDGYKFGTNGKITIRLSFGTVSSLNSKITKVT